MKTDPGYEKNILEFNEQLRLEAIKTGNFGALENHGKPDAIIAIGMGGSGLVGTLLQNLANDVNISVPVVPWKDFGLPKLPYAKNPLYLFISFSGDTKEVLDGFDSITKDKKALSAVVSSGGELLRRAKQEGIPYASFEARDLAPRQATGTMLYGSLAILRSVWSEIEAPDLSGTIQPKKLRSQAKRIAQTIAKGSAAVYADQSDIHLAYFWKIHLNETGKTFASWNVLPEMNHNEIVGFEMKPKNITAIFLEGDPGDTRAKAIRNVTAKIISSFGTKTVMVKAMGKNRLERTMYSIALGGLTAVELAKVRKVDPREVRIIQEIKKRIGKFR